MGISSISKTNKMGRYILALDEGTSSCRAILFNENFEIVGIEQQEFRQYYPKPGWVEQDPLEIWATQLSVAKTLIEKLKIKPSDITAIGITNQRETTVLWDKNTGEPIYNAIVWQDRRTSEVCNNLKQTHWNEYIYKTTGLTIDAYFSATKIQWLLQNVPEALKKAEKGDILFGTIDTWLIWKLTNGKTHVTDYSNASRTMLYNIKDLKWDTTLLKLFNIPSSILPKVTNSSEIMGYCDQEIFGHPIPIAGNAGDQQAALFGQLCLSPGMAKNTYGTGCFILMNTGTSIFESKNGLISTIAWGLDNKISYALEGSIFIAGAAIKWLRDNLKIIKTASETEKLAYSLQSNEGVYFVPAFAGLGAPYWNMEARGLVCGLTQGASIAHIARAVLESIAYQTKDVVDAMVDDSKIKLQKLFVDGGASVNNFLMQFQADILNTPVYRPKNVETTATGAAFLAALATGFVNINDLQNFKEIERVFEPSLTQKEIEILYSGWKKAIQKTLLM